MTRAGLLENQTFVAETSRNLSSHAPGELQFPVNSVTDVVLTLNRTICFLALPARPGVGQAAHSSTTAEGKRTKVQVARQIIES